MQENQTLLMYLRHIHNVEATAFRATLDIVVVSQAGMKISIPFYQTNCLPYTTQDIFTKVLTLKSQLIHIHFILR